MYIIYGLLINKMFSNYTYLMRTENFIYYVMQFRFLYNTLYLNIVISIIQFEFNTLLTKINNYVWQGIVKEV